MENENSSVLTPPLDNRSSTRRNVGPLVSVLVVSICAISYELIIGTLSSYLLGNSVTQFSLTIGIFLFAMGVGAFISQKITKRLFFYFVLTEILIAVIGGFSTTILYATFVTIEDAYVPVMIFLILAIGTCIGLEVPLLTRIAAANSALPKAIAAVFSFDYLGALIGSVAFPLVFLPILGVSLTSYCMALLNIAVSILTLRSFRDEIPKPEARKLGFLAFYMGVVIVMGAMLSNEVQKLFEQRLYSKPIIYSEQTRFQKIVVTSDGADLRLFIDGNLQFSTKDEYRYHEMLVHPAMAMAGRPGSVLVLGGGDGLAVRELLKYPGIDRIVMVDLDPAMTRLAAGFPPIRTVNHGSLGDPRVEIVNEDAFTYVQKTRDRFSLTLIDLPDPNNESIAKLYSVQFYRMLASVLAPEGVFVTQATSPYFARKAFWCIAHSIESAGFSYIPLQVQVPSFGEWGFVIASLSGFGPDKIPSDIPFRYLNQEVFESSLVFNPDNSEVPTELNTLDKPKLLGYYEDAIRDWD